MHPGALAIHDPLTELRILRKAFQLLIDVKQLSPDDEQLIATQVHAVLTTGQRQPTREDETPLTLDLDEETWSAHIPDDAAAVAPNYQALYFPSGMPEPEGFTVPERICQLGYRLTCEEYAVHVPALTARARGVWEAQWGGSPVQKLDADWYDLSDTQWLDPLIQAYLNHIPNITRVSAGKE